MAGYVQGMVALPPTVHHSSAQNPLQSSGKGCVSKLNREYKNDSLLFMFYTIVALICFSFFFFSDQSEKL